MIVTTKELFTVAYGRFAVGAYNIHNMEQALGLFLGHERAQAPFIIQLSRGSKEYAGAGMMEAIIRAVSDTFPHLIFAVHLDHGDEESCMDAIASGSFSSVMIDASHRPFDENVAVTRRVVEAALAAGISVEAELGTLGGVEDDIAVDEENALLTDPEDARRFVEETGCDALAVAVGTSHGAYKFSGAQGIRMDRLKAIRAGLPRFPLVLHGASSVPREEVERINAAGGALDPSAMGVDADELARAAALGVTKVNINTDGRLVWTRVHREFFRDHPHGFDLRGPGKVFVEEYARFVDQKSEKLLSKGKLDEMEAAIGR